MPYKCIWNRKEYQRARRKKRKRELEEIRRKHGKCDWCGWKVHPEILEFHHIDGTEKIFNFSSGSIGNYSLKRVLNEIKKCEIICPNCHRRYHFKKTNNRNKNYLKNPNLKR